MRHGEQIGIKFHADGTPRRYPGNTVIADIRPGSPAHAAMLSAREGLIASGLSALFILLPADSYHMTVIRGLNDRVRSDAFWPAALPKDAGLARMDAHVSAAVASVPGPGPLRMAFDRVCVDDADIRVGLRPADGAQAEALRRYRDAVADAMGLRLPGHDAYPYHITLAYTLTLCRGDAADGIARWAQATDAMLADQPPFETTPPFMAFYDDMVRFEPARRPADKEDA